MDGRQGFWCPGAISVFFGSRSGALSAARLSKPSTTHSSWLVLLAWIHLSLGAAVPTSYLAAARIWPEHVPSLWGMLPQAWRFPYTVSMVAAAVGYLVFSYYLASAAVAYVARGSEKAWAKRVCVGQLAVLIPSALWMPLTLFALSAGKAWLAIIQIVLALVALGTIYLASLIWRSGHRPALRRIALLGVAAFAWQTVALDACLWPQYFLLP